MEKLIFAFRKLDRNIWYILTATLVLFLLLLPLSLRINFMQNDDYVYYRMVAGFLEGNFTLDSYSAANFYTQGFIATLFALVFGLQRLPVLTLLFSILGFCVFCLILYIVQKKSVFDSLLVASIFFLNPLYLYSTWGFMTENYYMFFFLCALFFTLLFEKDPSVTSFSLVNLFAIAGFFIRQFAVVLLAAFTVKLLLDKEYKYFLKQCLIIFGLILFQYTLFPTTPVMYETAMEFDSLLSPRYMFTFIAALFIVLVGYHMPLVVGFLLTTYKRHQLSKKGCVYAISIALIICGLLFVVFNPKAIHFGITEFPYFGNVLRQKGFFTSDILSEKYHFYGIYDLYKYWDLISKVVVACFASVLLLKVFFKKERLDIFVIYFVLFVGLLSITPSLYDRYLMTLFPIFILFLTSRMEKLPAKPSVVLFISFLTFVGYNFSMDYVLLNKYVWSKATQLVQEQGIAPEDIQGTHGWQGAYGANLNHQKYIFSYDKNVESSWKLLEKHEITFPMSFYIEPYVYLYEVQSVE